MYPNFPSCSEQTKSPLTNEHCRREGAAPGAGEYGRRNYGWIFSSFFARSPLKQAAGGVESSLSSGFPYYLWFPKLTELWVWEKNGGKWSILFHAGLAYKMTKSVLFHPRPGERARENKNP